MTDVPASSDRPPLLASKTILNLAAARAIGGAAEAEAMRSQCCMCIAIVDDGGHLLHFSRMDGSGLGSIDVAIAKARTALLFKRPTKDFQDSLAGGSTALLALPTIVPFDGGVPLLHGGETVGAIGVSGGAPEFDGRVARAGAARLDS